MESYDKTEIFYNFIKQSVQETGIQAIFGRKGIREGEILNIRTPLMKFSLKKFATFDD